MPAGTVTLEMTLEGPAAPEPVEPPEPESEPDDEPDDGKASPATLQRAGYADEVNARLAPLEERAHKVFSGYLRRYEAAQTKRLTAFAQNGKAALARDTREFPEDLTGLDIEALLLDPDEWADKLITAASPVIHASFEAAVLDMVEEFGFTLVSAESPEVLAALETQTINLAQDVNGTLAKRVRRELLEALQDLDGANINTLQDAIADALPKLRGSLKRAFGDRDARALAIARTETNRATNAARHESMVANGVEKHEWWSSRDSHVRSSHVELDGQIRAIGEEFKPGLKFPLDPDAPAGEVINCRCKARPVIED